MSPYIKKRDYIIFTIIGVILAFLLGMYISSHFSKTSSVEDKDSDGYPAVDVNGTVIDCDDSNPDIFPENIEIPNDLIDQDCDGVDLDLQTNIDQTQLKRVVLYKNFIFNESVTLDSIVNNSRLVKIDGVIKSATLHVLASTTEYGYDEMRKHSVYFYVDKGTQGGHLGVVKKDNLIVDGDYFTIQTSPLDKIYELNKLPISIANGQPRIIDMLSVLNSASKHYIGAFVSTGIYGRLDELSIDYVCADKSSCEISILE